MDSPDARMEYLEESDSDRSDAYRLLSDLYFKPPSADDLESIREDLELSATDSDYEIRKDFDLLFPYPGGKLPPLESLYTIPPDPFLLGAILGVYADAGLTIDEDFRAFPDHISLEFLFMSYMIDTKKTELQVSFLEEHLMNWVPYYCEAVIKAAGTAFYREIAGITMSFLSGEYENIG